MLLWLCVGAVIDFVCAVNDCAFCEWLCAKQLAVNDCVLSSIVCMML